MACLTLCRWGCGGNRDLAALARAVRRADDLEDHLEGVRRRHQAKRALAAEVVAGRMSLREAAGHFRRLEEADPGHPPGPPGGERALREDVLEHGWMVLGRQEQFAAAVRWFAEAFRADPALLTGRPSRLRYHAACAGALAGCGRGRDTAGLDEEARAGFRRQALDWLRAELEARVRLLEDPQTAYLTVPRDLPYWLEAPDFAGVRGPEALGRLPQSERQAWQQLWADVADTLARAYRTAAPEERAAPRTSPAASSLSYTPAQATPRLRTSIARENPFDNRPAKSQHNLPELHPKSSRRGRSLPCGRPEACSS
jgi:hypothetical protein